MAKVTASAQSDLSDLVGDLMELTESFSWEIKQAAEKQMVVFADAIRLNWNSMNPWKATDTANFVSESIGYNVAYGANGDVVGMGGVFQLDSVATKYGRTKRDISAPQFAYWIEYGFTPNSGVTYSPLPFMSNAYYATLDKQDEIFANELAKSLGKRL